MKCELIASLCIVLQCVAVCCSVLQCVSSCSSASCHCTHSHVLFMKCDLIASLCSVLQCAPVCCIMFHYIFPCVLSQYSFTRALHEVRLDRIILQGGASCFSVSCHCTHSHVLFMKCNLITSICTTFAQISSCVCIAVCCSALQFAAVRYMRCIVSQNVGHLPKFAYVQCVAVCCSVLQWHILVTNCGLTASICTTFARINSCMRVAVCYNTLQCIAARSSVCTIFAKICSEAPQQWSR